MRACWAFAENAALPNLDVHISRRAKMRRSLDDTNNPPAIKYNQGNGLSVSFAQGSRPLPL
jgi:hypothetical protein